MNVLCVVVVLSLIPVCRPVSLACDLLLKPVEEGPDVTGRCHLIAVSSNYCCVTALLNSLFLPSFQVDVTSADQPDYYDTNIRLKMYGTCENKTFQYYYKTSVVAEVNDLGGRRPSMAEDELKEFEVLTDCLSLYRPQVLNTDHDYDNCTSPGNRNPYSSERPDISGRVGSLFSELFTCTTDKFLYYPRAAFRWAQQTWADLW